MPAQEHSLFTHHPVAWARLAAFSTALFPLMLLAGFLLHPNLLDLSVTKAFEPWIAEWHGNTVFHLGHLLVLFAVPFIIAATLALYALVPTGRHRRLAFWSAALAVFGAFMLAVDKGALTLTLTAFESLSPEDFEAAKPVFAAFLAREGWLWITWGFAVLPIGSAMLLWVLIRAGVLRPLQGWVGIVGLLLLMNPDIELISSVGAALMCLCYIPLAMRLHRLA